MDDEVDRFPLGASLACYLVCLISFVVSVVVAYLRVDDPKNLEEPARLMFYLFPVGFPLMISAIALLRLWFVRGRHYPLEQHRLKAVVLWIYGTPLVVLTALLTERLDYPLVLSLVAYGFNFILLTTIAFGHLPFYGGAWKTWSEVRFIQDRLRPRPWQAFPTDDSQDQETRKPHPRDRVYTSVKEVCSYCLVAVLPENDKCWNCRNFIRYDAELAHDWKRNTGKWERKTILRQVVWGKEWGHYSGLIFGTVYQDNRWSVQAITAKDHRIRSDRHDIGNGRASSTRRAKREVEETVKALSPAFLLSLVEE